ncbi:MAG: DUF4197 domain-containing protein [Chitinophagaceae bacterium]
MKKILTPAILSLTLILSSCETLNKVISNISPSEFEIAAGLKEALTQGLYTGFDAFGNPSQGNPLLRFALPGDAAKIEKTLRDLGLTSVLNQVTAKFTTAMSDAVVAAKPIFLNSVKQMTLRDVTGLLVTTNTRAATDYFKTAMSPQLMTAFRPIIDSTANLNGANKEWSNLVNIYNKIPLVKTKLESSLTDFLSARVIDGMFTKVAEEEVNIRTNYAFRKTELMKRVFGYADEQLKKRTTTGTGM